MDENIKKETHEYKKEYESRKRAEQFEKNPDRNFKQEEHKAKVKAIMEKTGKGLAMVGRGLKKGLDSATSSKQTRYSKHNRKTTTNMGSFLTGSSQNNMSMGFLTGNKKQSKNKLW